MRYWIGLVVRSLCWFLRSREYVLQERVLVSTTITDEAQAGTIALSDGLLLIEPGFIWDGASGPAVDTRDNMRASAAHDALYHLISIGAIGRHWRPAADRVLLETMILDGAHPIRALMYWIAVRCLGWLYV